MGGFSFKALKGLARIPSQQEADLNALSGWSQPLTQPAQQAEPPQEDHHPQAEPSGGSNAEQQRGLQQGAGPAYLGQDSGSVPQANTEDDPPAVEHQQDSQDTGPASPLQPPPELHDGPGSQQCSQPPPELTALGAFSARAPITQDITPSLGADFGCGSLDLDDLQHVQCGQAPLADSSLGQSAPSQAQLSHPSDGSHPSHDANQSGSRGSGLAAPAAQQLLCANLTSSSQQRSSGASASQSTPADGHGSGGATTQPTPAAGSGSAQARQRRREAGSGGGSSAGSRSQPDPRSTVAAGGGTDRGCPPMLCNSDSLLSLQLTRSPVPAPSLQPLPTGQSFPTPQLAQRPPSQLSQMQPMPSATPLTASPAVLCSSVASAQLSQPPVQQQPPGAAPTPAATWLPLHPIAESAIISQGARPDTIDTAAGFVQPSQQDRPAAGNTAAAAPVPSSGPGVGIDGASPTAQDAGGLAAWLGAGGSQNEDDEVARLLGSGFARGENARGREGSRKQKGRQPPRRSGQDVICEWFGFERPAQRPRVSA